MQRSSQVFRRNAAALGEGPLLVVNPERDELIDSLSRNGRVVRASTPHRGDYRFLAESGIRVRFEAFAAARGDESDVLVVLPREKERLVMTLHGLSATMSESARLWLAGEIRAGIKSAKPRLQQFFDSVEKRDAARHCVLFQARNPLREAPFVPAAYRQGWSFEFAGRKIDMVSLPGVFAHGRLDAGSSLLLDALEKLKPSGRVLDFACGSGVIGLAIASATTSVELTLLDVSAIALEAAGLSLAANDIQGELIASEGLDEAPGRFDWLLSNPPFHQGVAENRDIASVFIHRAGTFLNPGGKIVIVCNRHLPWAAGLRERFERVERLDANREYEVLLAANPRTR